MSRQRVARLRRDATARQRVRSNHDPSKLNTAARASTSRAMPGYVGPDAERRDGPPSLDPHCATNAVFREDGAGARARCKATRAARLGERRARSDHSVRGIRPRASRVASMRYTDSVAPPGGWDAAAQRTLPLFPSARRSFRERHEAAAALGKIAVAASHCAGVGSRPSILPTFALAKTARAARHARAPLRPDSMSSRKCRPLLTLPFTRVPRRRTRSAQKDVYSVSRRRRQGRGFTGLELLRVHGPACRSKLGPAGLAKRLGAESSSPRTKTAPRRNDLAPEKSSSDASNGCRWHGTWASHHWWCIAAWNACHCRKFPQYKTHCSGNRHNARESGRARAIAHTRWPACI